MELSVVIEPLPDRTGFKAQLPAPLDLAAIAATPEEAHRQLAEMLQDRLKQGTEIRTLTVPHHGGPGAGWLPDDDLTRDWLQQIQQYRAECDAEDRARLQDAPDQEASAP